MELFKEEVEKNSNGRISVETFYSGSLGGTKELLDQVKTGTIQMSLATTGFMTAYEPKLGVLNLPFLFSNSGAARAVMDSPFRDEIDAMVGASGFKALGFEEVGWRNVINRTRPVEKVADMQGLKIRLQPIKVHIETYRTLGANPVAMDFKELYTAMQQGIVDGMEVNYQNIYDSRFYEVTSYLTEIPIFYDVLGRWMNKAFWDSLPADLQTVVVEASDKAVAFQRSVAAEEDAAALQKLIDAGMKFNRLTDEQVAEFRTVTQPIYAQFEGDFGKELVDSIVAQGQK